MAMSENGGSADKDAIVVGLMALCWILGDQRRADRLMALTGLVPSELKALADDTETLAAALRFLEGHEPDLVACAEALGIDPQDLVQARILLEGAIR